MTSHVESNHGELKYKCKHCEYETKTSKVLGRHMQNTHDIKLKKKGKVSKERKHTPWDEYWAMKRAIKVVLCNDCGQEFVLSNKTNKNLYKKHVDKHETDKASCNCQADFKSRKEKVTHMKVVHEGYLGCDKCLDFFRNR